MKAVKLEDVNEEISILKELLIVYEEEPKEVSLWFVQIV